MPELPATRQGRLEYFEAHYGPWQSNAVAVGISTAQAGAIKTATQNCRTAFDAMIAARDAAKSATQNFYNLNNTMTDLGRTLISTIKSFAETTHNPNVYVLANVNPPAPPTPVPAPNTPTEFTGSVSPDGVVTLAWSATPSGPTSGVFFIAEKKRMSETAYTIVGATMERSIMDPEADVTHGPVQYRVKASRGNQSSNWTTPIVFNFGEGGGGGGIVASFVGAEPLKEAA